MHIAALEKELNFAMLITQILDYKNEDFVDGDDNHESWPKPVEDRGIVLDITVKHRCKLLTLVDRRW